VGTASGASRLRLGPNGEARWEAFTTPRTPLPSDKITGITSDGQGGAWLGTRAGLARAEDDGQRVLWSAQTFENGALPNREVLSITADRQGTAWVATGSGGAAVSSRGDAMTFTDQNAPLLHLILDAVYVAPGGLVWFGGAGGVNVYQPPLPGEAQGQWPVGFTRYSTDGALPADLVFAIGGDAKGRVWFGTLSGAAVFTPDRSAYGLGVFEPARWQTLTTSNSPLPDNKVHTLLVDRAGKVWLGTEGGIAVLQETAPGQFQWQQFTAGGARGLPDPWVQALLEAPDGRIWAGTHHGLAVYDPARPELGWTAYHANPLRRWVGYLWPRYWQANILSDDVTALAWID
jgi:ligand-binding sensor domain-containing protein